MKNACVILKKDQNVFFDESFSSVAEFFCISGYPFEEVRILAQTDEQAVCSVLNQFQPYDNVLLLCEQAFLPFAKKCIMEVFPDMVYQGGQGGCGIYNNTKSVLTLLSYDDGAGRTLAKELCIPYLNNKYGLRNDKFVIRSIGASDEIVYKLLAQAKMLAQGRVAFGHSRKYGEDVIIIYYNGSTPKMLIDDVIRLFAEGLEDCIYSLGEDVSLEEQLVRLLKLRGCKLSVAESFTGGGVGRRIVSVSGASSVYFEGINSYDELSKCQRLGVSGHTLQTFGAVSDQTAYEMATGLLKTKNCDIAIATTGLAGPKSDRSLLPVGLSFIAIGIPEKVTVYRYVFDGSREQVTETAINYALFLAYKQLKNI